VWLTEFLLQDIMHHEQQFSILNNFCTNGSFYPSHGSFLSTCRKRGPYPEKRIRGSAYSYIGKDFIEAWRRTSGALIALTPRAF
jgi:hypothetical protein